MMQPKKLIVVLVLLGLTGGCASESRIDPASLPGRALSEVVQSDHLDQYHSAPTMNMPPGSGAETWYFLPHGNLIIGCSGHPEIVRSAEFHADPRSAEERYKQAGDAWEEYVAQHTITRRKSATTTALE